MPFIDYLNATRKDPITNLFVDIETFQFNEKEGREKPSAYKNQVYSVAVSWLYDGNTIDYEIFPNFKEFFKAIESTKPLKKKQYNLVIHNGNRYDNHYLLKSLLNDYDDVKRFPKFMKQAVNNDFTESFSKIKRKKGEKIVLEKRVKASSNLDLEFTLGSCLYQTVDTVMKTNRSLRSLGETLVSSGYLDKKYLKTHLDYIKYNQERDMSYFDSWDYALSIFSKLSEDEKIYIRNDVIILASLWLNYSNIFTGFDINKITFSQNILEEYKVDALSTFQLTGKYGQQLHQPLTLRYSDYQFRGESLFDFLKHFYKGGLNLYNDKYLGKIINHKMRSVDRNSSYPAVMYTRKIPTFIVDYTDKIKRIKVNYSDNLYNLYEISLDEFNRLAKGIKSSLIRKAFVKYYTNIYENVYINSDTLDFLNDFNTTKITHLNIISMIVCKCYDFAAKNVLADNYLFKTQGKSNYLIDNHDPTNIHFSKQLNKRKFSLDEISTSKVILNGIYGLPALRAFYNFFKWNPSTLKLDSFPQGFENTERNVLFSISVTSRAFRQLLEPLKDFTGEEIDEGLIYTDTDSLYVFEELAKKIDPQYLNNVNLGKFKLEHKIDKFMVLNHKKYCFLSDGKIEIHCGGVPLDSFNTKGISFEEFVNKQFSKGVELTTTRNILTDYGTIALYPSTTKLDIGGQYPELMDDFNKIVLSGMAEQSKDELVDDDDDALYIETPFGVLSASEIFKKSRQGQNNDIDSLIKFTKSMVKYKLGLIERT